MALFYHPRAWPVRRAALALTLLAALPATAGAAEISVNRACFADPLERADTVVLTGAGFDAGAPYQVVLDGQPLAGGGGTVRPDGTLGGSFTAPSVEVGSEEAVQHEFELGVQQGANEPVTAFTVSRLLATFSPRSGNPRTLRVRFSVHGTGLAGASAPPVYLHYIDPRGRLARTVALGRAGGPCGSLRTAPRRLFPFEVRRTGSWRLQFDSRPGFTPGREGSSFLFFTVPVRVR